MVLVNAGLDEITIMDPMEGRFMTITHEAFIEIWTGIVVIMSPGNQFKKGKKNSNIQRLRALVKPHKFVLIKVFFATVIISALGLSISVYIQLIADKILSGRKHGAIECVVFFDGRYPGCSVYNFLVQEFVCFTLQSADRQRFNYWVLQACTSATL